MAGDKTNPPDGANTTSVGSCDASGTSGHTHTAEVLSAARSEKVDITETASSDIDSNMDFVQTETGETTEIESTQGGVYPSLDKLSLHARHFASIGSEDHGEVLSPTDTQPQLTSGQPETGECTSGLQDAPVAIFVDPVANVVDTMDVPNNLGTVEHVDNRSTQESNANTHMASDKHNRRSTDAPEECSTNSPDETTGRDLGDGTENSTQPRVRTPVDMSHLRSALSNSIDNSRESQVEQSEESEEGKHVQQTGNALEDAVDARIRTQQTESQRHVLNDEAGAVDGNISNLSEPPTGKGHHDTPEQSPATLSLVDVLNTEAHVLAKDVSRVTEGLRLKMGMIAQDTLLHSRAYQVAVDQYGTKCNDALSSFIELISSCQELDEAMHCVYDLEKMTLTVDKQLTHLEKLLDDD